MNKLKKALILDDDLCIHEMVQVAFSEYIFTCITSTAELETHQHTYFHFFLIDYKLKGETCLNILKKIKKQFPYSPIIVISAFGERLLLKQLIQYPIDAFIDKPLNFDKLRKTIQSSLLQYGHYSSYADHIQHIQTNWTPSLCLKSYAKTKCLNYFYLSHLFKTTTQRSYQQFVTQKKIIHAKKLLKNTTLSIEEISDQLGYLNPSAFIRFFKKHVQKTPAQYRRQ